MDRRTFLKNAATWRTPASGCFHGIRRPFGQVAIDMAKRFRMIRVPCRAWLVGLGLAVGIILTTGGSAAAADPPKPSCTQLTNEGTVFEILHNQTYALCAVSSCFAFNEVAYCKCDVEFGESISLSLEYDQNKDVCTVNAVGVNNGYMVSTFSVPTSNTTAIYTCPGGSNGAYAQCDGGICFKSTQGQSFPGLGPLAKDEIVCSCPITEQSPASALGYQISGPFPCRQSYFDNCNATTANNMTGSTLFVGAPTGTFDLLGELLTGSVPNVHRCFPQP
jgi:hypothetical protein